jgi:hypothetical protein
MEASLFVMVLVRDMIEQVLPRKQQPFWQRWVRSSHFTLSYSLFRCQSGSIGFVFHISQRESRSFSKSLGFVRALLPFRRAIKSACTFVRGFVCSVHQGSRLACWSGRSARGGIPMRGRMDRLGDNLLMVKSNQRFTHEGCHVE